MPRDPEIPTQGLHYYPDAESCLFGCYLTLKIYCAVYLFLFVAYVLFLSEMHVW